MHKGGGVALAVTRAMDIWSYTPVHASIAYSTCLRTPVLVAFTIFCPATFFVVRGSALGCKKQKKMRDIRDHSYRYVAKRELSQRRAQKVGTGQTGHRSRNYKLYLPENHVAGMLHASAAS